MKKSLLLIPLIPLFFALSFDFLNYKITMDAINQSKTLVFKNFDDELSPTNGLGKNIIYICQSGCYSNIEVTYSKTVFTLKGRRPFLLRPEAPQKEFVYYRNQGLDVI
jgi:hypothetical protein